MKLSIIFLSICLMACQSDSNSSIGEETHKEAASDTNFPKSIIQVSLIPSDEFDPVRVDLMRHYHVEMCILDCSQMRAFASPLFQSIDTSNVVDNSDLFCVVRITVDKSIQMSPQHVELKILDDDFDQVNGTQIKFSMYTKTDECYEILTLSPSWPQRRESLLNKKKVTIKVENIWLK